MTDRCIPPVVLDATGLSKLYGSNLVLDDVGLQIRRGEVRALVGGNGSGKSTLVKILAGLVPAEPGGTVWTTQGEHRLEFMTPATAKAAGLHFVHQDPGLFGDMSVAENLAIGRGFSTGLGWRVRWRALNVHAREVIARFHLSVEPTDLVSSLSPDERTMVAIARALQDQEDAHDGVLVLDEPTAALSRSEVAVLLSALRRYADSGQAIIFIGHRLDEVLSTADTVSVLRDGQLVRTCEAADLSRSRLAELIAGRSVDIKPERSSTATRDPDRGEAIFEVRNLHAGPVRGIDLTARAGEVVGLAGLLGAGPSAVLRAALGDMPITKGEVFLHGVPCRHWRVAAALKSGMSYVPPDRLGSAIFDSMDVQDNLFAGDVGAFWRRGRFDGSAERSMAADLVDEFGVVCPAVDAPIRALSGGNQQKIVTARALRIAPEVLLLDEPTQGVDVAARADIHALIRAYVDNGGACIVASSDLEELAQISDRVVAITEGVVSGSVNGPDISPSQLIELINPPEAA